MDELQIFWVKEKKVYLQPLTRSSKLISSKLFLVISKMEYWYCYINLSNIQCCFFRFYFKMLQFQSMSDHVVSICMNLNLYIARPGSLKFHCYFCIRFLNFFSFLWVKFECYNSCNEDQSSFISINIYIVIKCQVKYHYIFKHVISFVAFW